MGFPGDSMVKNPPANAGDTVSNPELGRSLGKGNCNRFLYSCLGSPMDRGAWQARIHGAAESRHDLVTKTATGNKNGKESDVTESISVYTRK